LPSGPLVERETGILDGQIAVDPRREKFDSLTVMYDGR
jgi:hypothetical protein